MEHADWFWPNLARLAWRAPLAGCCYKIQIEQRQWNKPETKLFDHEGVSPISVLQHSPPLETCPLRASRWTGHRWRLGQNWKIQLRRRRLKQYWDSTRWIGSPWALAQEIPLLEIEVPNLPLLGLHRVLEYSWTAPALRRVREILCPIGQKVCNHCISIYDILILF